MKMKVSASKVMRIISVVGIICLLALQWVWWRNAYRAVEVDFMKNAQECISEATSQAIFKRFLKKTDGFRIVDGTNEDTSFVKQAKFRYESHSVDNLSEVNYVIESALNLTKRQITDSCIRVELDSALRKKIGIVPKYGLKIHRLTNEIDSINKSKYNRIAIGKSIDTIYHQIGFKSYIVITFPSPITYYLKKGGIILILSLFLAILIGIILVFQYLSMVRERQFSEFIKDYTRMIAHELRTPVTGAQYVFQLINKLKPEDTELRANYIQEGMGLTKKILLNLENILYMAKSEQRKLPVYWLKVDMKEFIEKIADPYRLRDYNPKVVQIITQFEPENFSCRLDVKLMENALCNLLDNAIKYTHVDTQIHIYCSRVGDTVVIKVKDNGMGMSDEDQKRIFELFEQGSVGKNQVFPGFGIGLHFVERVVGAHDGKITVQSTLGKGTEFTITYTSK